LMFTQTSSAARRVEAKRKRRRRPAIAALICALAISAIGAARAANRDALWEIVHGLCVLHKVEADDPAPCAAVDLAGGEEAGWAVVKDLIGKTQFLLIPTRRLTGIEEPLVGTAALPNYWRVAWAARGFVALRAQKELPRDAIGMAINATGSRTQDQLHIHVDCIRPDVRNALSTRMAEITSKWTDLPVNLAGHVYSARWIDGAEPEPDPFILLADDARASGAPMRDETLAVIGARRQDGKEGFILLAYRAIAGGRAHAEDLLDHSCALAAK
jgi:CDP-diacylglycerol pyrophosphatase